MHFFSSKRIVLLELYAGQLHLCSQPAALLDFQVRFVYSFFSLAYSGV
jgi:hypothetical protein